MSKFEKMFDEYIGFCERHFNVEDLWKANIFLFGLLFGYLLRGNFKN